MCPHDDSIHCHVDDIIKEKRQTKHDSPPYIDDIIIGERQTTQDSPPYKGGVAEALRGRGGSYITEFSNSADRKICIHYPGALARGSGILAKADIFSSPTPG
jgi:hypothetical protein